MKKILLPLALMSALLVSCEKPENNEPEPEPEYAISISPAELTFGAEGGEQTVKVTSTYGEEGDLWWLETEEYCDWCEASLSSGENGEEVTFTVDSYDNTDETRTVAFTFYCGDKEADLIITQEAKVYSISVEPTELTFEVEGGEAEVTVTSSDGWDISNRPDWIDVSERYGENGATIIVTAEYNTEADSRSGEIVFTCGDKEAKISVTQKADDSPIIQFKDQYFLNALLERYSVNWNDTEYNVNVDRNNDGQISEKEASLVEVLDLEIAMRETEQAIRNISEMSYFTRLRYLKIAPPYFRDIDVSIESMDLSDLSQLEYLYIVSVELNTLDVSGCVSLTYLGCFENQLTSLDVSGCAALTELECSVNQLTSLDVSGCVSLTHLGCSDNQLTSLDVSNNAALTELWCHYNQLTSLDVSNNIALTDLSSGGNQLISLDVSNNTALTELSCDYNQLTSLDVSRNTALTELTCSANQLTSLDLSNNTALTSLNCGGNQLTSLDVSNNTALTRLVCVKNLLTSLDLHNNRLLENLNISDNPLQKLILYKYHIINDSDMEDIESEYGDIIEYME